MAGSKSGEDGRKAPSWTLRLAGPRDDSDESLWAPHARASGYGPRELLRMAGRNRGLAAVVWLAVFLPAAAWVWSLRPSHEATAQVVVKDGLGSGPLTRAAMQAEVEKVGSRAMLRRLAETLQLAEGEERIRLAVDEIERNLKVGSLPETGVITIQYTGEEPEQVADLVNALAGLYLDAAASMRRVVEGRAAGDGDLRALEKGMQEAREELASFEQRNRDGLAPGSKQAVLARSAQLGRDLRRLDEQLQEAERRLDALRLNAQGAAAPEIQQAVAEVAALRQRRQGVVDELRAAEGRRAQLDRLASRHVELKGAVAAAEKSYVEYADEDAAEAAAEAGTFVNASMMQRAQLQEASANGLEPWALLLLSALAAVCAALGATVMVDPRHKPVSHVADIATATSLPVLMMIEETQSNVS